MGGDMNYGVEKTAEIQILSKSYLELDWVNTREGELFPDVGAAKRLHFTDIPVIGWS
jgi:hypothetical protein